MANKKELTFDDFKQLALDPSLSKYEKIGFPDSYRKGIESAIFNDIIQKMDMDGATGKTILDIGCGCSDLVLLNIDFCEKHQHHLILNDSTEMLNNIKDSNHYEKIPGLFPQIPFIFEKYNGKVDCIIAYSLLHYVFNQNNMYAFIHRAVDLLKTGGKLLIGDIPNTSKKRRLLNSDEGKIFLSNAGASNEKGSTAHEDESEKIDDSIVFSIMQRFRNFNCETYLLPQSELLPMSNRREDILIIKR